MNARWQAIAREAAIAAEHIGIGITALGRANYAQNAWYGQAFFALSIGFERSAKLALVIDHALQNSGRFPPSQQMKAFGHDLEALLASVDAVAASGRLGPMPPRLPTSDIHKAIVKTLSKFASNITRYYNLDVITDAPRVAQVEDPISEWFTSVVLPVVSTYASRAQLQRVAGNAELVERIAGPTSLVMHTSETGQPLNTVFDASMLTGITKVAAPHVRVSVLQIARFLAQALSTLGDLSQVARLDVPYLSEFFAIYTCGDDMFRSRKTWSIYRP